MNLRSKVSLAALAAVSSVAALASAQQDQQCILNQPILFTAVGSEAVPNSCVLNGVRAETFADVNANGQTTLVVDLIGEGASFADSFGFDANGDELDADGDNLADCHPIDTNPNEGAVDVDVDCNGVVQQDLAIEFNED